MKCAVHPDVDATGYCRNCGKPMCPDCVRPVRDVLYCEDCLASGMGHVAPPAPQVSPTGVPPQPYAPVGTLPPPGPPGIGPNPVLAFFLGFLPGLGAFYNEQYGKGMVHLAIFLVLFIAGVNGAMSGGAEAALWICVAALWIYMPIDALRTAQAKRAGQTLSDPLDNFSRNRPIGPILLIGAGLLLLLNNFD
ncbi:MAG: B-box zinc finger protein, partial [Candidatus Acidiferrum sp.]